MKGDPAQKDAGCATRFWRSFERHGSRCSLDMAKPNSPTNPQRNTRPRFIDNAGHMDPAHRERLLNKHTAPTKDPAPFRQPRRVGPLHGHSDSLAAQTVASMTSGEQESPDSTHALEDLTEVSFAEVIDGSR